MSRRKMCEICQSSRCPVACPGHDPLQRRKGRRDVALWGEGDFRYTAWETLGEKERVDLYKKKGLLNNTEIRMGNV